MSQTQPWSPSTHFAAPSPGPCGAAIEGPRPFRNEVTLPSTATGETWFLPFSHNFTFRVALFPNMIHLLSRSPGFRSHVIRLFFPTHLAPPWYKIREAWQLREISNSNKRSDRDGRDGLLNIRPRFPAWRLTFNVSVLRLKSRMRTRMAWWDLWRRWIFSSLFYRMRRAAKDISWRNAVFLASKSSGWNSELCVGFKFFSSWGYLSFFLLFRSLSKTGKNATSPKYSVSLASWVSLLFFLYTPFSPLSLLGTFRSGKLSGRGD